MATNNTTTLFDVIKWLIVSAVIPVATLIIDKGFRERAASISEMEAYNEHTALVTDYSKVAERRLLAQYFATVTPSDELRARWALYFEIVDQEYREQLEKEEQAKVELKELEVRNNLSPEENMRKLELTDKIKRFQYELTPEFEKKDSKIIIPNLDTIRLGRRLQMDRINR